MINDFRRFSHRLLGLISLALLPFSPANGLAQSIRFHEATNAAGITPNDPSGFGHGSSFGDFNGDGRPDIYMMSYGTAHFLFRNNGGTFTDIAASAGVQFPTQSDRGMAAADYDNDGDLDLYIAAGYTGNVLYRNNGNNTFSDVTSSAGVDLSGQGQGVAWGDYNRDGRLDLFVTQTDGNNVLFRQGSDHRFTDVTSSAGIGGFSSSLQPVFFDVDGDGDVDLFVARQGNQANLLYINNGNGTFSERAQSWGIASPAAHSQGAAIGDYDRDGDLDVYVCDYDGYNLLFKNQGNHFDEVSVSAGVRSGFTGNRGALFADFNDDGWLDLYVTRRGDNKMYRNNGDGTFSDVSSASGTADTNDGYSPSMADYDNDGDLDIFFSNTGQNSALLQNNGPFHNWLQIKLRGNTSNRGGVGAKMTAWLNGQRQTQAIIAGQAYLCTGSDLTAHFALGSSNKLDSLVIQWPSGTRDRFANLTANQKITLEEGTGGGGGSDTTPPVISSTIFADNFNAGSLNGNNWRKGTNAGNQAALANNALELRASDNVSGWIVTVNNYAALNTTVSVKVATPNDDGDLGMSPAYNLSSPYGIYDQANWYRFYTYRNGHSGAYRLYVQWKKNGVDNGLDVTGNLVINGTVFLRLRFDNTHIHFEASLNGVTWIDTYNEPFGLPGYTLNSRFYYELAGYNTSSNGVLTVDDFAINNNSTPAPDTQPPVISNVAANNITTSSATIVWTTNEGSNTQVEYGLTTSYGTSSSLNASLVTSHTATLSSLQAKTTYHYRVKSKDAAGNLAVSGDFAFTTLSPVQPVISAFTPTSGPVGTPVTITGSNFTGATSVAFNGVVATGFTIVSANQIRANVPAGAATGKISVTTATGTATSANDFAVVVALAFGPTDDAYVESSSPTKNFGTSSRLRVRKTSSAQQNAYLKFNISGLSGSVQSARLRLYVADASNDGGTIYKVSNNYLGTNTPWLERGLTWNNAPTINGSPLASTGAVSDGQTVELDVTAAITGNGVYSFAVRNNSSNTVSYRSKQGTNPPVLVIQTAGGAVVAGTANSESVVEKSSQVLLAAETPESFALLPNYPNPLQLSAFNAETKFIYQLPERAHVKLALYDLLGREVMVLVDAEREFGTHEVTWNGRDAIGGALPSGTYIYSLQTPHFRISKKLLLIK